MRAYVTASLLVLPLLGGCSLDQRLDKVSADIHQRFADAKSWEELPMRVVSWQQALAMIHRCNDSLKSLDSQIEEAERDSLSVYTDMIPGVSYYGYFTKSIEQLSDQLSAKDMQSNVNITFSLPSLTQVPYRVYAAKARTYSAIKAKEGKERECVAQLYNVVHARALELQLRELEQTNPDLTEQQRLLNVRNELTVDAEHWKKMCALLGDYSARWVVLPSSVPHINWGEYHKHMSRLDDLVVCSYALKLEQARMAQYQVALRYLPTINTSLYSPSLFSSSGGTYQGSFLDGEDTRINLSISYSLDTNLREWNSYKRSKEQYEKVNREVTAEVIDHKNKLTTLRDSMREYNNWRSYMQKRIEYLRQQPANTADELITRDRSIYDMQRELLIQAKSALESESAVILEYGLLN